MDRKQFIEALDEAIAQDRVTEVTNKQFEKNCGLPERIVRSSILHELRPSVIEAIKNEGSLTSIGNRMIHRGNGASAIGDDWAAGFLIEQALKIGAEAAIDGLERILATEETEALCIMAIRGINCTSEAELAGGIRIIPFEELPPSTRKNDLQNSLFYSFFNDTSVSAFNPRQIGPADVARSALVANVTLRPFVFDSEKMERTKIYDPTMDAMRCLNDIRLCLSVSGHCCPLQEVSWVQLADETLEVASSVSRGVSYQQSDVMPRDITDSILSDFSIIQPLAEAFLALPEKYKEQMRFVLSRLIQSLLRRDTGDRAVDLSIALESLLLGSERGDNRFKLGLRAGLLSTEDVSQKLNNCHFIRAMYDIRSDLIHGTGVPERKKVIGKGNLPVKEIVTEATEIARKVIATLITGGEISDWHEIELSGGLPGEEAKG